MIGAKVLVDTAETVNKFPQFFVGEYGFPIVITPILEDGTKFNLTDEVTTFKIRNINKTTFAVNEIVSYADSVITYIVKQDDFKDVGIYEASVMIEKSGIKIREINLGTFAVFEK